MRYTSLSSLLIPVIVLSKFCDCQDICENPELAKYENVISENGSYKYSQHYHYSRTIRHNQPYPVVSDSFKKISTDQNVTPKFSFKFYGNNVTRFEISRDGYIRVFTEKDIGVIHNTIMSKLYRECEMVDNNDFIAVNWYFRMLHDGTTPISKITSVIHSGGKISLYYENIPTDKEESPLTSTIQFVIHCGKTLEDEILTQIITPPQWITSDTLAEFEPIENVRKPEITTPAGWMTSDTSVEPIPIEISCSKHDSIEKCQNATTSSVKCIWYEKAHICINSDDNDVKDTTSEINGDSKHDDTPRYLYIVIPVVVVVAFCVICIGCAIWMYKRKKSNP